MNYPELRRRIVALDALTTRATRSGWVGGVHDHLDSVLALLDELEREEPWYEESREDDRERGAHGDVAAGTEFARELDHLNTLNQEIRTRRLT